MTIESMSKASICLSCGAQVPADSLKGFCPRCLYRLGLDLDPEQFPLEPAPSAEPGLESNATPDSTGTRSFGDYEILDELGHGGVGVVYKARQKSLDRVVALKLLLFGPYAPAESVKRFRGEAVAAAALQHPNIAAIHEVGFCEGQHFIAMDYVEGQCLSTLIRSGPLPARRAAGCLKKIAKAIQYAHERGILHRDIKPANILIDTKDEPRVTDFGLAKRLESDSELTVTGQLLGSPNYMPPEQADGKRGAVSRRSDVYALGAVLYHMLTGRPPFLGESLAETVQEVLNAQPVSPRLLYSSVPKDLETICLKCLEKEPAKRYATAQVLAEELERFLEGKPVLARPVGRLAKTWRWCRRNPVVASLAASLILVFAIGTAEVVREWRVACLAHEEAEKNLWGAYLAQARANRWSGRPGRRFDSLRALSNAAAMHPSIELRNEAIACLALSDMQVRKQWHFARSNAPYGLVFDHRYERFALTEQDSSITVGQVRDRSKSFRLKAEGKPDRVRLLFSNNGQYLAEICYGGPTNEFRVWDLTRRVPVLRCFVDARSFCFRPGDQQVVLDETAGTLHFYALPTGEEVSRLSLPAELNHLCFSPDGKRLAVSRVNRPAVMIIDLQTQKVCRSFGDSGSVGFMSWSPDGRLLACPCEDQRVHLWDPDAGEHKGALEGHTGVAVSAAFDHAGDLLASSGWDGMTRLWDARLQRLLLSLPGGWIPPGFAPDDRILAIGADVTEPALCDVASGRECQELGDAGFNSDWKGGAQFSPDGRLLTTAGEDGVRIWDLQTKRLVSHCSLRPSRSAAFLPDGSGLLTAGLAGVERWPIVSRPPDAQLKLGPAERLCAKAAAPAALSCRGRNLLAAENDWRHVILLDLARPAESRRCGDHPGVAVIAVSPNGKWFATGTWQGQGVRVFDMPSGELRRELPVNGSADCAFSPGGEFLATGSATEYCLWKVGSWEPVWTVAREGAGDMIGSLTFSPDGQMVALLHGRMTRTKLAAVSDGRELATLEAGRPLCFSPDGSRLATVAEDGHSVLVWHLPLIRRQLAQMKLDWDTPPVP